MFSFARLTLCLAMAATAFCDRTTFAQGKKGGATTTNNVATAFDTQSNTLYILGDGGNNMISITLLGTNAVVSPGIWGHTSIDGQSSDRSFVTDFSNTLNVVVDSAAGQDRVWITVSVQQLLVNLSLKAGDGSDDIAISPSSFNPGCQLAGGVEVVGGNGDDSIYLGALNVFGTVAMDTGDGNDSANVHVDATLWSTATFQGGKGRDDLTAPWVILATAIVSGFENVIGR